MEHKFNSAAWLVDNKAYPIEVKPSKYPSPSENEVIIKTGAVAINPIEWKIQDLGTSLFPSLKYPLILGSDVAGEVVEVGSVVKRFKVGDRVTGLAASCTKKGGFQEYTVLEENLASQIPDSISYEEAAVIPLGFSTAACGLFQKDHLALQYPSLDPKSTGETILISGGASSIGANAIQLAVSAGYEVFTTCSEKNFDLAKKLGASKAFDYNIDTVTQDIIEAFKGKRCGGALAISKGSEQMCIEVVGQSEGKKFISFASPIPKNLPDEIGAKSIFGNTLKDNEVGKIAFVDYLPQALEQGKFKAAPIPHIVGKGLSYIQVAFEEQKRGASAKKIVVSL